MTNLTNLPIGEEDDTLDGEELEDRIVRPEEILGGEVEEEEGVESNRDAQVVDEGDIDVSIVRAPAAVFVQTKDLQDDDDERHQRFDDAELKGALLAKPACSNCSYVKYGMVKGDVFEYPLFVLKI